MSCVKPLKFVAVCYSSSRKLIQFLGTDYMPGSVITLDMFLLFIPHNNSGRQIQIIILIFTDEEIKAQSD